MWKQLHGKYSLDNNKKKVQYVTTEPPLGEFKCTLCDKRYARRNGLKVHMTCMMSHFLHCVVDKKVLKEVKMNRGSSVIFVATTMNTKLTWIGTWGKSIMCNLNCCLRGLRGSVKGAGKGLYQIHGGFFTQSTFACHWSLASSHPRGTLAQSLLEQRNNYLYTKRWLVNIRSLHLTQLHNLPTKKTKTFNSYVDLSVIFMKKITRRSFLWRHKRKNMKSKCRTRSRAHDLSLALISAT